ncbi:MAG: Mycothiol acetyltransferase [Anaerolineae bacterium]|nr:Mycothiol acetyltransferase [Anaerolineae bacterium]
MDSSGRSALREMRTMARLSLGILPLALLNDLTVGISLGFVWEEDGRLVGNVSVYPAKLPRSVGSSWIIANVGVHPLYQRRGIARKLMLRAMQMIRDKEGAQALLQVDDYNTAAIDLYKGLGFVSERTFSTYRRSPSLRFPVSPLTGRPYIRRRRRSEWRQEMQLAMELRPGERGGIGWLRPVVPELFRPDMRRSLRDFVNLRSFERLVVEPDAQRLQSVMWVERAFGATTRLSLMVHPSRAGIDDEALLGSYVRHSGSNTLTIEHPADDEGVRPVLERYRFLEQRTVIHMRWTAH